MKLSRHLCVEGEELLVFDDLISRRDHVALARSLLALPYCRAQYDRVETRDDYQYYVAHLDLRAATRMLVFSRLQLLLRKYFPDDRVFVHQAYINRNSYGDITYVHTDSVNGAPSITGLYFGHETWQADWGGETMFFDRSGEAQFAVSPTPRRMVLFRGSIQHKIGVPTRQCTASRLTLAYKFGRKTRRP